MLWFENDGMAGTRTDEEVMDPWLETSHPCSEACSSSGTAMCDVSTQMLRKKNPLCHSGLRPNMSSWEWIQCRHARSVHSFVSLIKLHVKYAESDIAFSTVQYELSFPSFLGGSQLREQNRIDSLTAERLRLTVNPIPLSSRLYVQKFIFRISG